VNERERKRKRLQLSLSSRAHHQREIASRWLKRMSGKREMFSAFFEAALVMAEEEEEMKKEENSLHFRLFQLR
jgi:hypothetical protein